jgi:hypothetical protein
MRIEAPILSADFQRLYCDAAIFQQFSVLHPVDFSRVLPFQAQDPVMDNAELLLAETAHLANPNEETRQAVVDALGRCCLLSASDVAGVTSVIDSFDADFFELMGEAYANAGMFICALRWYRELIALLEAHRPDAASDTQSVYASVGYCLYSLGLHPEAVLWSRSCIGPRQTADTVSRALIEYEAQSEGGCIQKIERLASRTRYTVSAVDPAHAGELTPRLKLSMQALAPFIEPYVDWVTPDTPVPEIQPEGYPFQAEYDAGDLTRHRMNLIFSLCGHADELTARGYIAEAKRLLFEAALLEPQAEFIQERLR